jgi:pimeloyl-ACP methyl ester carboxylesterase
MVRLPGPKALLADWLAMRASMTARHLPLRLPDAPPDVAGFWAEQQVDAGPLPDLAASMQLLESTGAGAIYRFAFPSRVVSADAVNNIVPGRYYLPARPDAASAAPFLLLLHVNGARDGELESWHAKRLMQRGCRVAQIVTPYQRERRPERLSFGASVMTPDLPHTLAALGQAVCDAADVLRWARAEGAGQVMIAGWSLGGLVAALVATQMPLDGALLVEPVANLAWMMTHRGLFPGSTRRQLRRAGLSQAALEAYLAPVLPANLRPQVPLAGLRILAARYDQLVGYQPLLALWRAWGQPALHVEPTGHVSLLFSPALAEALDALVESVAGDSNRG